MSRAKRVMLPNGCLFSNRRFAARKGSNRSREDRCFPWTLTGSGTFFGVNVSASRYEFPPKNEPAPGV